MPQAARIKDMHECPMESLGAFSVPHLGGPITGPGVSTVLVGGLPAAVVSDACASVKGAASAELLASGQTTVKGAMVLIN